MVENPNKCEKNRLITFKNQLSQFALFTSSLSLFDFFFQSSIAVSNTLFFCHSFSCFLPFLIFYVYILLYYLKK